MKRKLFFTGTLCLAVAFGLALVVAGCGDSGGGGGSDAVVTTRAIGGVTAPTTGGTPATTITATAQYTGTVSWSPAVTTIFAASTAYTATITLTAESGYTFSGVPADFFTVAGATSVTNAAGGRVVTAVFPATGAAGTTVTTRAIGGVTAPATGGTPATAVTETTEYTGTVTWSPAVTATFAASTAYTATITLAVKAGYTFSGVPADFFTVANATSVTNAADNGVVTAVFQATTAGLTITASSMALEVVWPKFGDLAAPAEYAVRYKADATGVSDVVGSISVPTANITQAFTGTFMANITGLIDGVSYRVWVFRSSDTYTIATPLYTGTGSPVASSTVTLESTKSHGTAGANSITGLATSAKYVVKQENLWHPIGANGNLGNGGTLDAAVSATVSNVAAIRNLNNDNTYNVFLVKAFADDNATLGTADTGGKNTIADVKALTAPKTFTITSTGGGGTLIVFTNELNATAIAEKTINETDQIGSAAKRYRVTEATNVSTTKIKAATTDRYAEIDLTPMQEGSVIVFTVQ